MWSTTYHCCRIRRCCLVVKFEGFILKEPLEIKEDTKIELQSQSFLSEEILGDLGDPLDITAVDEKRTTFDVAI